jgi:hypothetical protein
MNPRSQLSPRAQHHPSNDLLGTNRWIALLARISSRQKTIARQIFENQAMGTQPARRLGNHNVPNSKPLRRYALDTQGFAVSNERQHAATARLKPDLMTARQQSPAQLLEQGRIVPKLSRGTQ